MLGWDARRLARQFKILGEVLHSDRRKSLEAKMHGKARIMRPN
jgi:hypothetical protein